MLFLPRGKGVKRLIDGHNYVSDPEEPGMRKSTMHNEDNLPSNPSNPSRSQ